MLLKDLSSYSEQVARQWLSDIAGPALAVISLLSSALQAYQLELGKLAPNTIHGSAAVIVLTKSTFGISVALAVFVAPFKVWRKATVRRSDREQHLIDQGPAITIDWQNHPSGYVALLLRNIGKERALSVSVSDITLKDAPSFKFDVVGEIDLTTPALLRISDVVWEENTGGSVSSTRTAERDWDEFFRSWHSERRTNPSFRMIFKVAYKSNQSACFTQEIELIGNPFVPDLERCELLSREAILL